MNYLYYVILGVISYFIGNFSSARFIAKTKHDDITKHGSGNPGTLNTWRAFGFWAGVLTFVLDMLKGLISIRRLHMRILEETGFSGADEMLYPENHRYLSDLLSYVAVGARSVENQQHRLTASGLTIPVGMKNPTSGDVTVMLNAINAAQHSHTFIYRGWEVVSTGNDYTHAILRGYVDEKGISYPNYHYEDLLELAKLYSDTNFVNPAVIVDCNHSNSGKKYEEQVRIAKEVLHSTRHNPQIRKLVKGLMIESYIEDGCQKITDGVYGKSITDPCLGWEKTEKLIFDLYELRKAEKEGRKI